MFTEDHSPAALSMRVRPFRSMLLPSALMVAALIAAPPPLAAQRADSAPGTAAQILDDLVRTALERNLSLARQRLTAGQAASGVRQARGVLLPTLAVDARYSEFSGVVNIGDFINPAYAALNQLIGENRFPTNVAATLPFRQESRLRATQLVYNQAAIEQWRLARTLYGVSRAQQEQAARQLAADIQLAWLGLAGAARVVDVYAASLTVLDENERVADRLVANGQGTVDAVYRARAACSTC